MIYANEKHGVKHVIVKLCVGISILVIQVRIYFNYIIEKQAKIFCLGQPLIVASWSVKILRWVWSTVIHAVQSSGIQITYSLSRRDGWADAKVYNESSPSRQMVQMLWLTIPFSFWCKYATWQLWLSPYWIFQEVWPQPGITALSLSMMSPAPSLGLLSVTVIHLKTKKKFT